MSCTQSEWNCGHFRAIALVTFSAAVLFMTATTARATISEVQIAAVSVSSSLGSGEFDVKVPFDPSGQYSYLSGPDPIAIYSNDANHNLLATIQPYGLSVTLDSDPTAGLSFGVLAANTPTNFTISTSSVVFGAIPSPSAVASAALTVTDVDSNGASITALPWIASVPSSFESGDVCLPRSVDLGHGRAVDRLDAECSANNWHDHRRGDEHSEQLLLSVVGQRSRLRQRHILRS